MMDTVRRLPQVQPLDEHNEQLIGNVHPPDWMNPEPDGVYNLVVIGAGTGGLVTAAGAGGLGARVALIERHLMGGDCLNTGCVPSKCVIRSARAAADVAEAARFGVHVADEPQVDFSAVMARMRRLRAGISKHDSAARCKRDYGIDVFLGDARFTSRTTIEVGGQVLRFRKAVIAAGGRPRKPVVPGLAAAGYHTSDSIFSLTQRPDRLVVVGGGPIGSELTQTFRRLGCTVTLLERGPQLLSREDRDAAAVVTRAFEKDGVRVVFNAELQRVEAGASGRRLHVAVAGKSEVIEADEILVAVGRQPNVEGLQLDAAGVRSTPRGIVVDDRLRTDNPNIYAVGDCCMRYQFTHAADAAARMVIQNALFFGRKRLSALTIPWCTYTDPEIAHVGLSAAAAEQQGIALDTYVRAFTDVDRAIADGETDGMVKIHVRRGSGRIVGAMVVARHAGEMISEISVAMAAGMRLGALSSVIHPYPTQAEAIRQVGDMYNRTRLTPRVQALFRRWLAWQRRD